MVNWSRPVAKVGARERLPSMPTFESFFEAVNGYEPFPWQARLAKDVATTETWPAEVGVPTGLGKTACLGIAIWWLASQADRQPAERTAPTRIWWVVNRRLLVDSTWEDQAKHIARLLHEPAETPSSDAASTDVLGAIADRLRSLSIDANAEPLQVVRLRGGVAWRRPTDPSQPAVVLSTIPMYGSRLLFRGYGSSRSMRPIDAALAGTDSLILVDEAHLAGHLMQLFPALQECAPQQRLLLNPSRSAPRVVALTATGDRDGQRFELDEADEAIPEITRRLDAAKPTKIWVSDKPDQVAQLAKAAASLLDDVGRPATCVIFVNAPRTARALRDVLLKAVKSDLDGGDIVVLTGQAREREARAARERILREIGAGPVLEGRSRHLVVVATQTLEVGADIDAEFLVTEACGVRALTQRLGRVNRLGRHRNPQAIYVHCPPKGGRPGAGWPVYGTEPGDVLERLLAASGLDDVVDLSPRRVAGALGEPGDDPGRAPEVLPALLWEWIKTTTPPSGEAPVEPFFSGVRRPEISVSIIWRIHVPESGERLWPRPRESEFVDVPISEFRGELEDDQDVHRLGPDGISIEEVPASELRPGDRVVRPTDWGRLDSDGWAPGSTRPVVDVSLLENGLPLNAECLGRLCSVSAQEFGELTRKVTGETGDDEEVDESQRETALDELLEALRTRPPSGFDHVDYDRAGLDGWGDFVSGLDASLDLANVTVRGEVPRLRRGLADRASRIDEFDEMSLAEIAVDLDAHNREVGTRAGLVASALGVPADVTATVERAGSFHDVGKADHRFQRWLDPGRREDPRTSPIAKSTMPRSRWSAARAASGWPSGGRHEDLSGRLVQEWLKTANGRFDGGPADLLVHLVVSHHGNGRPLVPPVEDTSLADVTHELDGTAVWCSGDLSEVDWSQPARFRRLNDRYGPWGLALLEAIVRQADHAVSAGAGVDTPEVP